MGKVIKLTAFNQTHKAEPPAVPDKINFDKQYKTFLKKLKTNESNTDFTELKYMRKMVRQLIPKAAEVFQRWPNDKNAKALEILINQSREMMADMAALNIGPKHIQHIKDIVMLPAMSAVVQNYLVDHADLKKNLRKIKQTKLRELLIKKIDNSSQAYGTLLNAVQQGMEQKLEEYFIGKVKK